MASPRSGCPTLAALLFLPLGWWLAVLTLSTAIPAVAQYPSSGTNPDKNAQHLRAVAVLEWTGDQDHPKSSRLVPVSIFDGNTLEDAGVYMAHPEPLALEGEVEYQLQQDGRPVGLFDVQSSGQQQGSWFGLGKWKPLPVPKAPAQAAKIDAEDYVQSDTPVLHRKHADADAKGGDGAGAGPSGPPADPDRPTLHKGGDAGGGGSAGGASDSGSGPAPDPDRPTLHKGNDSGSGGGSGRSKSQATNGEDEGHVESVAKVTDPERPRITRGKAEGYSGPILPTVIGLPADMKQVVAVSDPKNRPVHAWDFTWANADDEAKMKADMEDLARVALGLSAAPAAFSAPPAKLAPKTATKTGTAHKPKQSAPPAPLVDEQFRVFELAYGAGATMVLSARTDGASGAVKFVTLIAQPDLYGNAAVLVKSVTDMAHLDDTPRMRLVDAVDAMADNRGELLFELRGASQRQFALYRVLRGQATRIFVSGGEAIGTPSGE